VLPKPANLISYRHRHIDDTFIGKKSDVEVRRGIAHKKSITAAMARQAIGFAGPRLL
jgi:hypothetical protein